MSDVVPLTAGADEELVPCDLSDKRAVDALVQGCDAVVHMGGIAVEGPFEPILEANIRGVFHVYEAVRRHGVRRVVFASSNHVTGFYGRSDVVDVDRPRRPDGYYALSKGFGEDLSRFYYDRYGVETVCIRIGASYPEPTDPRMLITWLSHADLTELVRLSLTVANVGHKIVYGVSRNRDVWWDNRTAADLGFAAQDTSEAFRSKIERQAFEPETDAAARYQGGAWVCAGPFGD